MSMGGLGRSACLAAAACCALAILLGPVDAAAQTTRSRWVVSVDAGYQTTRVDSFLTTPITFERFGEEGSFEAPFDVDRLPTFNVRGGVELWRGIGVGAGFTRFRRVHRAELTAQIPHPLFFNRNRTFFQQSDQVQRERSLDFFGLWRISVGESVALTVFGGPSVFFVSSEVTNVLTRLEQYPYEEPPIRGSAVIPRSATEFGYNVGFDTAVRITQRLGLGWLVRYSAASRDVTTPLGGFFDRVLGKEFGYRDYYGGFQVLSGLRVFF